MADSIAPLALSDLIPNGMFVGASLILQRRDRFLFGVRPARSTADGRAILEITGVGGGLESADATPWACALREAQEEIGCRVNILPVADTTVVRGPGDVARVRLSDAASPAAVVFRRHRTPPHSPWHDDHKSEACLVVFRADLVADPEPSAEHPHLIWLAPEHIVATARRDVRLADLVDTGAVIFGARIETPSAWARLTDSHEALVLGLEDEAEAYYDSLRLPGGRFESPIGSAPPTTG